MCLKIAYPHMVGLKGKFWNKISKWQVDCRKKMEKMMKMEVSQKPMQVGTLETLSLNLPAFDLEPVQ
jgi:anaerobic ribonucleoside-triphosphate reductase